MTDDTLETSNVSPMKNNLVISSVSPPVADVPAAAKLREFEDVVFGLNASRINGEVEHGIGSPYADMTPHQKAHYAALEQLVAAEKAMADATAALAAAETAHEAAIAKSEAAQKAMDDSA